MDIVNIVLNSTIILFGLPVFIKEIVSLIREKHFCLGIRIEACDVDRDNKTPILYIVIDNKLNHDIAVTKILVNGKVSFDYSDEIKSVDAIIPAHLSKKFKMLCPFLDPDQNIDLMVYTSNRQKPYKSKNNISILKKFKKEYEEN